MTDGLDAYLESRFAETGVPGMSCAAVLRGELVLARAHGVVDVPFSVPATPDVLFGAASITKAVTGVAVALLAQEGLLGFDDPVTAHVAGLPESWSDVTLRRLLSHTSGIPDVRTDAFTIQTVADDRASALAAMAERPRLFAPGHAHRYNQGNYVLLGFVIEVLSGQTYSDFCRDRVLGPLGVDRAVFDVEAQLIANRSYNYTRWRWSPEGISVLDHLEMLTGAQPEMLRPAAGLAITAADLARWAAGLLSGRLLERRLLEDLWEPIRLHDGSVFTDASGDWTHWGLGWGMGLNRSPGRRIVGFNGNVSSTFLVYPDDDLTVAVLTNCQGSDSESTAAGIADRILATG